MTASNQPPDWVQQAKEHIAQGERYEQKAAYEYERAATIIRQAYE